MQEAPVNYCLPSTFATTGAGKQPIFSSGAPPPHSLMGSMLTFTFPHTSWTSILTLSTLPTRVFGVRSAWPKLKPKHHRCKTKITVTNDQLLKHGVHREPAKTQLIQTQTCTPNPQSQISSRITFTAKLYMYNPTQVSFS